MSRSFDDQLPLEGRRRGSVPILAAVYLQFAKEKIARRVSKRNCMHDLNRSFDCSHENKTKNLELLIVLAIRSHSGA